MGVAFGFAGLAFAPPPAGLPLPFPVDVGVFLGFGGGGGSSSKSLQIKKTKNYFLTFIFSEKFDSEKTIFVKLIFLPFIIFGWFVFF